MSKLCWFGVRRVALGLLMLVAPMARSSAEVLPVIVGDWWSVAELPDVSPYNTPNRQPVDFGIWRDANGTWRIWSCIRNTSYPGKTRLLHGWQSDNLFATNWTPTGNEWTAETSLGETEGGMQAPFVHFEDGVYHLFYGSWDDLARATSSDGAKFTRVIQPDGTTAMFESVKHPRDAMVLKIGDVYHMYYTEDIDGGGRVYVRTSTDLENWSEAKLIAYGGLTGTGRLSAECPFVYYDQETQYYYLFRTQEYGADARTSIYRSTNPTYFGVGDEADKYLVGRLHVAAPELFEHEGRLYIAALKSGLNGIRIAEFDFLSLPEASPLLASGGQWQVVQRRMNLSASGSFEVGSVEAAARLLSLPEGDPRVAFTTSLNSPTINFNRDTSDLGRFPHDIDFEGSDQDQIAISAKGTIRVLKSGEISFGITANDGARLVIDGEPVLLDNTADAMQDTFGSRYLTAGEHQVELVYFQKRHGAVLELLVANELGSFTSFAGEGSPKSHWSLLRPSPLPGD